MRLAFLIGWKDCLVRFQSRATLIFVVVLPLAMTIVTGLAFKGFEVQKFETTVALVTPAPNVVGDTGPHWAPRNVKVRTDLSEDAARAAVEHKEIDAAIILRRKQPSATRPDVAELVTHANESPQRALVEVAYQQLVETLRQGTTINVETPQPVEVGTKDKNEKFNSFTQAVTGNGVMFILLNCLTAAGITIVRERRQNTLARMLISPVSRNTLLLGKMLGVYFVGLAQAFVVFGFGASIGVLDGDSTTGTLKNIVGVTAVTLLLIAVATALGLVVSALCKREETAESLGVPIAVVLTALGGGMFPTEKAPAWMQVVAKLLPSGQAMDAYHELLWRNGSLAAIAPNLLILAVFAVVFFVYGASRLRWE